MWLTANYSSSVTSVCYTEATVYQVVMAGLTDTNLQQRCSAQALLGNVTNINQLVDFCNAHDSGKLGITSTFGAIKSQYQKDTRGAALSHTPRGGPGNSSTT